MVWEQPLLHRELALDEESAAQSLSSGVLRPGAIVKGVYARHSDSSPGRMGQMDCSEFEASLVRTLALWETEWDRDHLRW